MDYLSSREKIASTYIRGEGIEVGALHQPLAIPKNVSINYVDRLKYEDLILHYPELEGCGIVRPDIIDDAQTLETIGNDRYDFCIANHVLEHMNDPIGALLNWIRILKPGGILYLSVPDIGNPLDTGRNLTTLEHFIVDHVDGNDTRDFYHYIECAKYWNKLSDDSEIQRIAQENYEKNYSIHYHTFNNKSIHDLLLHLLSEKPDLFSILNICENTMNGTDEYVYILEKGTYVTKCFEILENRNVMEVIVKPVVDVIVPVYNAYADLIRCIYSLLRHQTNYRIILIDDCSSDSRIHDLFTKLKSFESNQLKLLNNEENLGFVKTVNRGMQYSHQDVILLNSDTIVTRGWVEKLIACAYSDGTIGTVTPFTNNGTICSIPKFCERNAVPEGFTVDSYAEFIEKNSFMQYYEIPTAVGFCMLIKRTLLEKIGYFDDEAFGKGYGEENDYCMRANRAGYRNVLCDNTYIYHKGEASFSETKAALSKKNMEILSNRYPDYLPCVASFCQKNPLRDFLTYISERTRTWDIGGEKKRVLYVLHNLGGGSEKHALELIDNLSGTYVLYIVQVQDVVVYLTEYNNGTKITYQFPLSERIGNVISSNSSYRLILTQIIVTFHINLVHVHHLLGHTLDVFLAADECGIPVVFTAHDFFAVCPRINLLNENSNYCHDINNSKICSICLHKTLQVPETFISEWRNQFLQAFERCDLVIAPSKSTIDIINDYYPIIKDKSIVVEHGHGKDLFDQHVAVRSGSDHESFHIGYFGVLVPHKGRELFYALAQDRDLSGKVRWSIFGISDVHSEPGYYPNANITVHGAYRGYGDLRTMVQEDPVDLVIFPSKCPETFSFTLSEAWAMGIPVLVSDLGALKERVEKNGGGWIVDVSDVGTVKEKIASIMRDRDDYSIKTAEASNITLKPLDEVADEYSTLYSRLIEHSKPRYQTEKVLSNMELFYSMVRVTQPLVGNMQHLSSRCEETESGGLLDRLVLCYKENGLWYTIKRAFTFSYTLMNKE
ncbi:glycosyltransferase [uncultured Methanoculleus sp.]|jgi:GT2 family glycosyltransferase/glycosyltransferase involved in cell wall biosynthesis|uniref:Glycosyltransferase n=1 Tax=Methanoculleus palmolei TaxID=72612 RepID=A0ABD8AAR6_9EURY|nr:glycosyltransferase [Methanoculleus palmolei]